MAMPAACAQPAELAADGDEDGRALLAGADATAAGASGRSRLGAFAAITAALLLLAAAAISLRPRLGGAGLSSARLRASLTEYIDGNVNCALTRCDVSTPYLISDGWTCQTNGLNLGPDCGDRGCTNSKGAASCYVLDPSPHTVSLTTTPTSYSWTCGVGYFNEEGFCVECAHIGLKAKPGIPGECASNGACFPGDAGVRIAGEEGGRALSSISVGDSILVARGDGRFAYEPVIGFLHKLRGEQQSVISILHERGSIRATDHHLVFASSGGPSAVTWTATAAARLRPGDHLRVVLDNDAEVVMSRILSVRREAIAGMDLLAPLTSSGTLVVDGVVASAYASPFESFRLPHSAAHAVFFPHRLCHSLGFCNWSSPKSRSETVDSMDPLAAFALGLVKLSLGSDGI